MTDFINLVINFINDNIYLPLLNAFTSVFGGTETTSFLAQNILDGDLLKVNLTYGQALTFGLCILMIFLFIMLLYKLVKSFIYLFQL